MIPAPTNDELWPDLADLRPPYQEACWQLIHRAGWRESTEDILRRLDRCDQFPDPDRLPIVRYVLRHRFKLEVVARESVHTLRGDQHSSPERAALVAARQKLVTFDWQRSYPTGAARADAEYLRKCLAGHLEQGEQVLRCAAEHHRQASASEFVEALCQAAEA